MSEDSTAPASVLVVDDDDGHCRTVRKVLERDGHLVTMASSGEAALDILRGRVFDLLLTDLMMPGMSGIELLKAARAVHPTIEVVVMTAFGSVERAVEAMREGAYDFIEKPIKRATLSKTVRQGLERKALVAENVSLRTELDSMKVEREIVGRSEPIRRVLEMVRQVAPTQATVLIEGASGTGKELVARALHRQSARSRRAFVAVNCAALPASILESELFGHEKGAFTGAHQRKPGRFELADRGTLFLDEIGELELDMQAKLLRVLQEGEFERVGGTKPVDVDVRIVAATNKNLESEVEAGQFREDLFYRLNVVPIEVPPLSARDGDVVLLAEHFVQHFAQEHGRNVQGFTRDALDALAAYDWPGNVRELRNVVERVVVLGRGPVIDRGDLPQGILEAARDVGTVSTGSHGAPHLVVPIGTPLDRIKRDVILETLRHVDGDKKTAARLLGIATRTIYRVLDAESE